MESRAGDAGAGARGNSDVNGAVAIAAVAAVVVSSAPARLLRCIPLLVASAGAVAACFRASLQLAEKNVATTFNMTSLLLLGLRVLRGGKVLGCW